MNTVYFPVPPFTDSSNQCSFHVVLCTKMSQAGNFKKFEDDPELNNKNINLNEPQQGNAAVSSQSQKKGQPAFMKKMVEKKEIDLSTCVKFIN